MDPQRGVVHGDQEADPVVRSANLMVGNAQLIKAVASPDARLEIVDAENIQAGLPADSRKQLADGLYALACLAADLNRDINAHSRTSLH